MVLWWQSIWQKAARAGRWSLRPAAFLLLSVTPAAGETQPPEATDPGEARPARASKPVRTDVALPSSEPQAERLGIAGGLLFAEGYTLSATLASAALLLCWNDPASSTCALPSTRAPWYDLYIPLAGPFVALRHRPVRDDLKVALSFTALGAAQSVGVLLVAFAWWKSGEPQTDTLTFDAHVSSTASLLQLTQHF